VIRIGIGYDLHTFAEGRRLVLGGVEIPFVKGLQGHSDGDVVLHAVADALLGASGNGDIGEHFPDSDDRYRDIDSALILKDVLKRLNKDGWRLNNIDIIIILEEPKLEHFKENIRDSIAGIMDIDKRRVNIKATTAEGVGAIGKNEAAASQAVALIEKR